MDHTNLGHSPVFGWSWSEGLSGDSAHQTEDSKENMGPSLQHDLALYICRWVWEGHNCIEWWLGDFVFFTCAFFAWGHLLEAVFLALGESVLLPLTWGKLIGGISSEHYLAKPKVGAKASWTGVPLPPAPTSRDVACLYLWLCSFQFFCFEEQVSLCGSLWLYWSCNLSITWVVVTLVLNFSSYNDTLSYCRLPALVILWILLQDQAMCRVPHLQSLGFYLCSLGDNFHWE